MGNFTVLKDIPEMYHHCKEIEDNDMTLLDFFTDHLINIDGLFDKHEGKDEQKPHEPLQHNSISQTTTLFLTELEFTITQSYPSVIKSNFPIENFLVSDFASKIFRPPVFT